MTKNILALANSVPAAAVIQGGRALFGIIRRKGYVGGFLIMYEIPKYFFGTIFNSKKLEFNKGY